MSYETVYSCTECSKYGVANCSWHKPGARIETVISYQVQGATDEHRCQPPVLVGLTLPQHPDWECGVCGRVWRDWNGGGTGAIRWWAEVRGPTDPESSVVKASREES